MHLVHVKDNYTSTATEVLDDPTGLAVIGVLFYEVPEANAKTKQMDNLIKMLAKVGKAQGLRS